MFGLCSFIVACRFGAVGVHVCIFLYVFFSYCVATLFFVVLCWVAVIRCEFVTLYKIIYFVSVFFLCKYY
jgi:hypothetical protein